MGDKGPPHALDRLFLRRFLRLHRALFPRLLSRPSGLLALLLIACAAEQLLAFQTGLLSGTFLQVLGERDLPGFQTATARSLAVILAMVTVRSLRMLLTALLSAAWRRALGHRLQALLLGPGHPHYRLRLDTVDQRVTADCAAVTGQYSALLPDLIIVPPTVCFYVQEAWVRTGWLGPVSILAYFLLSTGASRALLGRVVALAARLQAAEGRWRTKHAALRGQSESLAFTDLAAQELARVAGLLREVTSLQTRLACSQLPVDLSVNLFNYLGAVVSYLVIAVPIFTGAHPSLPPAGLARVISEAAFVLLYLSSQLGRLVAIVGSLAGLAAATHRVAELQEELLGLQEERPDGEAGEKEECVDVEAGKSLLRADGPADGPLLEVEGLTVRVPGEGRTLVTALSLTLRPGESLLVTGPSSAGKTSLLRALRGLWPRPAASVRLRAPFAFLPQRPFLGDGRLGDLLAGPGAELEAVLAVCELVGLVARLGPDHEADWCEALTPGEQQRVAWAQLLLARPALALVDEATSAVGEELEGALYTAALARGVGLLRSGLCP
jgi:ATP-binding cassette subfamily D (ALD) protein 4